MAKRIATTIAEYVEAREEVITLRRQKEADPAVVKSPVWLRFWNDAVAKSGELQRQLSGGNLAKAERLLREKGLVK